MIPYDGCYILGYFGIGIPGWRVFEPLLLLLSLLCEAAHEDPGRLGKDEFPSPSTEERPPWVKVWGVLPPEFPSSGTEHPLLDEVVLESLQI